MTHEERKAIQKDIWETQDRLAKLQNTLDNLPHPEPQPEPWNRWRANPGEGYYHILPDGSVSDLEADRYRRRSLHEIGS